MTPENAVEADDYFDRTVCPPPCNTMHTYSAGEMVDDCPHNSRHQVIPDEAVKALRERLRHPAVTLPVWLDNDEIKESEAVREWRANVMARLSEEMDRPTDV